VSRVVPVGVPGGVVTGGDDARQPTGVARLGRRIARMDMDLYRVWRLAAQALEADQLTTAARDTGVTDPRDHIRILADMGLLVWEGDGLRRRADGLALALVGVCLGNGANGGSRFAVAGRTGRAVVVDPAIYEVLLLANGAASMAAICRRVDEARGQDGNESTLDFLCRSIAPLVSTDAVQLDEVAS
jgi:hypothetical protein